MSRSTSIKLLLVFSASLLAAGCHPWDDDDPAAAPAASNSVPSITSNGGGDTANINAQEDQSFVTTVTYTDPDIPADTITYDLAGNDATEFAISSGGVLTFFSPPDFENPTDDGIDGTYEVTVMVDDGNGGTDSQAIFVTVTMSGPAVITSDNTLRISRAILGALLVGEPIPPYCDVFSSDVACAGGAAATAAALNEPAPLLAQASAYEETTTFECDADNNPETPHNPDDGYIETYISSANDPGVFDPPYTATPGDLIRSTAYNCNNGGEFISDGTTESEVLSYTPGALPNEFTREDKTTTTDSSLTWLSLSWDANRSLTVTDNSINFSKLTSMYPLSESESMLNSTREFSDGRTIVLADILFVSRNDYSTPPVWPVTQVSEFEFGGNISHTDFGFAGFVGVQTENPWIFTVTDTRASQNDPFDPDVLKITYEGTVRIFIEGGGYVDGIATEDTIRLDIYEDGATLKEQQNYTQEELFYGDLRAN